MEARSHEQSLEVHVKQMVPKTRRHNKADNRAVNSYYSRQDRQKNRVKLAANHGACTPRRLGTTGAAQDSEDGSLHSNPLRNYGNAHAEHLGEAGAAEKGV